MSEEERGLGDEFKTLWDAVIEELAWSPDEFIAEVERLIEERRDFYPDEGGRR